MEQQRLAVFVSLLRMRIGTREIISLDYFDILGAMSPSVFTHSA